MKTPIVRIAVPLYLPKLLDYVWAGKIAPQVGDWVDVEVAKKKVNGLVMEIADAAETDKKLKPASPVKNIQPLSAAGVDFFRWASRYNMVFPGEPVRACLMAGKIPPAPEPEQELVLTGHAPAQLTAARRKVLSAATQPAQTIAELARRAEVSAAVVSGLIQANALVWQNRTPQKYPQPHPLHLNPQQERAAHAVSAAMQSRSFQPFLLDGVTGSGKTEVYFSVIEDLLKQPDGQVLVLVPEISLTPQLVKRFTRRFGFAPAVWHSAQTPAQKRHTWWGAHTGKTRVVIGARSALFLPFQDLRLLVVDEEHDPSYKQEEGFRYHGRDMAIVRARLMQCPVLLASATPSLETWQNSLAGRFHKLELTQRHGHAQLPDIRILDMTQSPPASDKFLSPTLLDAVGKKLLAGEQALLFLNRRGFAPLLICRQCGWRADCPSCDASLVVHGAHMACHHCGFEEPLREACPQCRSEDKLFPFGPGTRKLKQEVLEAFPAARIAVVDRDSVTTPAQMREVVEAMEKQHLDILIGTQMITKGHHFPNLTLVGVVDADLGLAHGDLRAAERTFQLLTQVAGRAGRAEKPGQVWLQTHSPEHPLFAALKAMDRDAFFGLELKVRQRGGYPPFGRLLALILSGETEQDVRHAGSKLVQNFPHKPGLKILGPAPAPLARLRDRWRYRLLLHSTAEQPLHAAVKDWLSHVPLPKGVRVDIDVDPQSFL